MNPNQRTVQINRDPVSNVSTIGHRDPEEDVYAFMLEDVNDKNLEIEKLQKEIVKIKEDKTEAQLVIARDAEINSLKKEVKELKNAIDNLQERTFIDKLLGLNKQPQIVVVDPDSCVSWQRNADNSVYDTIYRTWRKIVNLKK